jgi:two-component system response regulator AtoC
MQEIFKTIGRVASSDATVMIYGESGTGKELAANALHAYSPRRTAPFVKVSCASFVETLLESELFGHEKGAFTHAISQRKGRFETANKGTIFLDEIGEMSLNTQKKLLRVLQEREFERVGSSLTIKVDVRVIAATNRDLLHEVAEGRFREDLYYRLNVIQITMPPLRDRRDDIPVLVEHFLDKHRLDPKSQPARISEEAMAVLMQHSWPGNVRDLENTIERAVVLSRGDVITPQHLSFVPTTPSQHIDVGQRVSAGIALKTIVEETERLVIEEALQQCGHSQSQAAERLGLTRSELEAKIREYNIPVDSAAEQEGTPV